MNESAAVLRELGAKARVFRTVMEILIWYADRKAAQFAISAPLEPSSVAMNHELIAETHATMAKIAYCLKERDPEIDDCELRHMDKLPEWARGYTDQETLANLWEFQSIQEMASAMAEAEMHFRHRAKIRGLLPNGSPDSPE